MASLNETLQVGQDIDFYYNKSKLYGIVRKINGKKVTVQGEKDGRWKGPTYVIDDFDKNDSYEATNVKKLKEESTMINETAKKGKFTPGDTVKITKKSSKYNGKKGIIATVVDDSDEINGDTYPYNVEIDGQEGHIFNENELSLVKKGKGKYEYKEHTMIHHILNKDLTSFREDAENILRQKIAEAIDVRKKELFSIQEEFITEAVQSTKLRELTKMKVGGFYEKNVNILGLLAKNWKSIKWDQVLDVDFVEMSPAEAKSTGNRKGNLVFWISDSRKEHPNSNWTNIEPNSILAVSNGNDILGEPHRIRSNGRTFGGSDITNMSWKKISEVADRVFVLNVDDLIARYSAKDEKSARELAKKGAIAMFSPKQIEDIKRSNQSIYKRILANRVSGIEGVRKMVDDAIKTTNDILTKALSANKFADIETTNNFYGKTKPVAATNILERLMREFEDYHSEAEKKQEEIKKYGEKAMEYSFNKPEARAGKIREYLNELKSL